jgi:divinyl chlorophyllide a 8-vinyl-reductase
MMAILVVASVTMTMLSSNEVLGFSLSMKASSPSSKGTTVIAGATGYIGKSTVRESIRQGYHTVALVRDLKKVTSAEGERLYGDFFEGAEVVECDVSDPLQLADVMEQVREKSGSLDAVVSCLASRSGIKKEAYAIDYQATLNCMEAGAACGAKHFVLLSAICVRKPLLQFQHAKLKFEASLQAQTSMTYSIVRPTAFFKSVSGQLERLQEGKPFLMFQDSTRCNPIAESDLATFLIDCIREPSRSNQIINLGGPDKPMTKIEQGEVSDVNALCVVYRTDVVC